MDGRTLDEYVISPLQMTPDVTPEDSVSQVGSVNSKSPSTSSKRRREARIKAAVANLQAKQLTERLKRDNEVYEQEIREEMAQRELELKLKLLRKKRESEMSVISARNQAEVAQLEHEMLQEESIHRRDDDGQISKVSKTTPSFEHYLVPSPNAITETESKDDFPSSRSEANPAMTLGYVSQAAHTEPPQQQDKRVVISSVNTPVNAVAKSLPVKVLEFHTSHSNVPWDTVQAPVTKLSVPHVSSCSTNLKQPQQTSGGESKCLLQTTVTPVSSVVSPQVYTGLSSSGCITVPQPTPQSFHGGSTSTPLTPSVVWSLPPGPKYPERLSEGIVQTPSFPKIASVSSASVISHICNGYQAWAPHESKFASPICYPQPCTIPQVGQGTRNTSTPFPSGVNSAPQFLSAEASTAEEPVDAFIDRLREGQETIFQASFNCSQTDSSMALLRAQEQQRLPPLELFKFTGKPIEWPKFIERFRDQIHNKMTLVDSDRMAYLFQNLDGEAKKAVESLGVTGHSYPAALKTLKRLFGNPNSVASAYLKSMLDSPPVTPNDRQALRDYYYQVKACTTWCIKMGQSAILQTPEYLGRATMRLPMNLRVRWYEHINDRSDRSTLLEFETWLRRRVDTLFNPLEDFICEEWNKKQGFPRSRANLKLHPLATTTKSLSEDPPNDRFHKKDSGNRVQSFEQKCVVCPIRHRVAFCPAFKSKSLRERKKITWDHKLCFNCLKANHQAKDSPSTKRCLREQCGQPHHTLLHEDPTAAPLPDVSSSVQTNINKVNIQHRRKVMLQVLPVEIHSQRGVVNACAVLDPGSDSTLIRKDLAERLQLDGETRSLSLNTVGSDPKTQTLSRVSFSLSSKDHPQPVLVHGAWVIDKLNVPYVKVSKERAVKRWSHLSGVDFPELEGCDVMLLIGADMAHLLVQLEVRQGRWDEPIGIKTPLGWTLFGNVDSGYSDRVNTNFLQTAEETCLPHQIERFWEIDSYGTMRAPSEPGMSAEDKRALAILQSGTMKEEGHYKTPLLWKSDPMLPNNRAIAVSRLHSTEKKLKKNPELARKYQDVVNDYITKGHARRMIPEEARVTTSKTWYLPHHAVLNPNKPGKVRVVFDAASKFDGVSLNDKLLTGPDLLNNLVGILMRFRTGKIGVIADVEQMYHQVKVAEEDRDSLRFLWRDLDEAKRPDEYQMTVHVFGAVDSPCCANYALQKTADDQRGKFSEDSIHAVKRNFYMDDLLASKPNTDEAKGLVKQLTEILSTGGFRLTKWMSNSREVLTAIPSSEVVRSTVDLDRNELPQERALGVKWCAEQDLFCLQPVKSGFPDTKRGILSATSSVFDPLGIAAPYVVKAKLIIQELWRRQINWDEELPGEILQSWQNWKDGLKMSQTISVPRWYGFHRGECQNVQLHIFCDASEIAYGAVAYYRTVTDGRVNLSFIMSKTRLAPIKTLTIPRLELQAAVVGIRLRCKISEEIDFEVDETYLWSDSKIVLHYIGNVRRRFSVYVSHRVAEIVSNSDTEEWRHVPGVMNVADDCTRGLEIRDLTSDCRWISGPEFLMLPPEQWPNDQDSDIDESELELKASVLTTSTTPEMNLVEWEKYSKWRKLVRLYAWWMRYKFKRKCKARRQDPPLERQTKVLSAADLTEASLALCKQAQRESFKGEYEALMVNLPLPCNSSLLPFQPVLVDGVIRVGGRLNKAPIPFEAKHQAILPPTHCISRLLVQDCHEKHLHIGREHTLALVRQQFWIPRGKSLTRKIINDCLHCKRRRAKPNVPVMASLPKERLALCEPPFTNTGVDYFGPMNVKRGRVTEKRWGCLFTCLTTRAVHLELAGDLSTDSFIMALRRFRGRRGDPSTMRSDNGTNFVGANRELAESLKSLNQERITGELAHQGITWCFNPPSSPHMGGIFESVIKQVKRAMKTVINDQVLPEETLHTVLVETEAVLNSRPLTSVSDDLNDYEVLTPNHFLIGRASPNSPPGRFEEREVNSRKRWRMAQALTDMIWQRWRKEYLPSLTVRSKWNREQRNLQEGDLILLKSDGAPRSHWPLGRVLKTFPGDDGRVRVAEVKTPNGTLMRPVAKLCLLEESS